MGVKVWWVAERLSDDPASRRRSRRRTRAHLRFLSDDAHSDAWMREVPEALERELETREAERAGKAGASHAHETAANDPDALADVAYRLRSFLYERSGHEGAGDTLGVGAEDDLLDASRFLSELSEALRVNTVSRGRKARTWRRDADSTMIGDDDGASLRTIPTPTKASRPRHRVWWYGGTHGWWQRGPWGG